MSTDFDMHIDMPRDLAPVPECVTLPPLLEIIGPHWEADAHLLMAIGSLVRETAFLDQSFGLAISTLTGTRYKGTGQVPSGRVRADCERALASNGDRVPELARAWFARQLTAYGTFITKRNRIMHDLTLTASRSTAARIEHREDGSVRHMTETPEHIMVLARVAKYRSLFINTLFLVPDDLAPWRTALGSWAAQVGASPASSEPEPWETTEYRSLL